MRIHSIVVLCLAAWSLACGGPTVWLDDELDAGSPVGDDGEAGAGGAGDAAPSEPPRVDAAAIDSGVSEDEPGEEEEVEDALEGAPCSTDLDCLGSERDRCDTAAGQCVECMQASDCDGAEEPLCDTQRARCVECLSAVDCPGGVACDPIEHECEL